MNEKIQELVEAYVELETAKATYEAMKAEILADENFVNIDMGGITVKRKNCKTYKYIGAIADLEKKHPDFVEKKAKNLAVLREVDKENIKRSITETVEIKGIKATKV